MPLRKGINLQEILQRYFHKATINVIEKWFKKLKLLPYVGKDDCWREILEKVCQECKQLRLYFSDLAPLVLAPILVPVMVKTLELVDKIERFFNSFNFNGNERDDLEHICISIFGSFVFPCLHNIIIEEWGAFPASIIFQTLQMNCNLTSLTLRLLPDYPVYKFQKRIIFFSDLEQFECHNCSTEIVKLLTQYCPKLRVLDLSGSAEINDDSVEFIIQNKNLEILNVRNTGISLSSYRSILINCPKLANICGYFPLDTLTECLTLECTSKIIDVQKTTVRTVNFLSEKFTNISTLQVTIRKPIDLSVLAVLRHLSSLQLSTFDFNGCNMDEYFILAGRNLKDLVLHRVSEIDVSSVSRHCINLKSLVISRSGLKKPDNTVVEDSPHFRNLNSMKLFRNSREDVLTYMNLYRRLTEFHVAYYSQVTHEFIETTLPLGSFRNLTVFTALRCRLNKDSALMLIEWCNDLRLLGELRYWTAISYSDILYLKKYIKEKNLALQLKI